MNNFTLELCTPNLQSVEIAAKTAINRIELCSALSQGGLTPSSGIIKKARQIFSGEIAVLLRSRNGDFLYNDHDFEAMLMDIDVCKDAGVECVVVGILTCEGKIDVPRMKKLVNAANPLQVCCHRAIDMTANYLESLEDIIACGCHRILTSGAKNTAFSGIENLKMIQEKADGRIEIMAGSGVTSANIEQIYLQTGITSYHFSAKKSQESQMKFQNPSVSMGGNGASEYSICVADCEEVLQIKETLKSLH
jgi:copper homeostasis protein